MNSFAKKLRILLELVKFEHSVFALPYAFIGALFGVTYARAVGVEAWSVSIGGSIWPSLVATAWITVVMVGARSFAFVVNRAVDKEIDARNPRTATRAVPAGMIRAGELWAFAAVMLAAYLVGVWQLAPIVRWLWPVPLVMFVVYPYLKRFTWGCHFWLGACLGLAPIGGWLAVGGPVDHLAPWLLGLGVMAWTAGFDIIYATLDREHDVRDGIQSVPAVFGVAKALLAARALHVLTVPLLFLGGYAAGAGWSYTVGVVISAALLVYENAIVSADDLSRVGAAFFTMNGAIAIVVFIGAFADRLV